MNRSAGRACLELLVAVALVAVVCGNALGQSPRSPVCELAPVLRLTEPPMTGNAVWELKVRLRQLGFDPGDPDNERYDRLTAAAVRQFQESRGLVPDGVVGPRTWDALAEDSVVATSSARSPRPEGEISLLIDSEKLTLTVLVDGQPYKTYPVAVGRPKESTLTPVGEWRIIHKAVNWGGGFGTRWLGLNVPWGIYGIHGTNKPYSIGTRASAGCIRMFNRDVEELYEWVSVGTRVKIVGVKPSVSFGRRLRQGVSGKDVVEVQLRLNEMGFSAGDADGRFGPNTRAAVERLQRTFGLPVDGEVWTDVYYILGLQ
ncbi:MAG: peptidoglycan-binding protein [Firmicutes bacterium]|nr:peptidoglycan-binding protein [Bacillota bacterium]